MDQIRYTRWYLLRRARARRALNDGGSIPITGTLADATIGLPYNSGLQGAGVFDAGFIALMAEYGIAVSGLTLTSGAVLQP